MRLSSTNKKRRVLLIGPLPPPFGGARTSFKLFYDFLNIVSRNDIKHFDLPVRFSRNNNPPGRTDFLTTLLHVVVCLIRIPFFSNVVVFGSRNFCFSYGLILLLVSKLFKKKFYFRFFGGYPVSDTLFRFSLIKKLSLRLLTEADKILVQTQSGARSFPDYLQSKVLVIVGYRAKASSESLKFKFSGTIKLLYTGRITEQKGIYNLISAFRHVTNHFDNTAIELHLYGPDSSNIIDEIGSLENVFYYGKVDNDILRKEIPKYDIFVFPTHYENEGHPGSIIEALMAGVPVIASNLPGISEIINDGVNGLLVKPNDKTQLADAMIKLIKNETLRHKLSNGALQSSVEFDADYVLPKLAAAVDIELEDLQCDM